MRIGIHPGLRRHDGGIYQYTTAFMRALDEHASAAAGWDHSLVVLAHDLEDAFLSELTRSTKADNASKRSTSFWELQPFRPPSQPEPAVDLAEIPDPDQALGQPDMHKWLRRNGVELMLYPSPHRLSFEARIPFVMAVHDLQHRLHPEFPEVSANGEWERREYVLRNAAHTATLLIAESEIGREDILDAYGDYGLESDRVKVLPYAPERAKEATEIAIWRDKVRLKYDLPGRYLFYPAQFWPHKNHLRLVEALASLKLQRGLAIPLVLTGAGTGSIREEVVVEVRQRCESLGLNSQVRWLGYVSDEEKSGLFAGAEALVMPTFFGPTNLPFIEAWTLGCPVVTSRIRGITEQVGDAALTVDPCSVPELATAIAELWSDAALRATLVSRGRARIREYTTDDFRKSLVEIVEEAVRRVRAEACQKSSRIIKV